MLKSQFKPSLYLLWFKVPGKLSLLLGLFKSLVERLFLWRLYSDGEHGIIGSSQLAVLAQGRLGYMIVGQTEKSVS